MNFSKRSSTLTVLISLTVISILAQLVFFVIHYRAATLVDSLVGTSIYTQLMHTAILMPILFFLMAQVIAYALFVIFIWMITMAFSQTFPRCSAYHASYFFWLMGSIAIFTLNRYFYPESFFASLLKDHRINTSLLIMAVIFLIFGCLIACYQVYRRYPFALAGILVTVAGIVLLKFLPTHNSPIIPASSQPNIIIIGLDSLRPDFINYWNKKGVDTPNINAFLSRGTVFTEAYTPLARTFPAWMSILTSKYPKKNLARINLNDPALLVAQDTLGKKLKQAGYHTVYATDEKRFSNIIPDYGFDQVLGPGMGVNDFLLGGLSDFPLTNLLVNLPFGQFIFPYNYSNRAAAITYEPNNFIRLIANEVQFGQNKPLFLAVHFCVTHWPFTWAKDQQSYNDSLEQRYRSSIKKVDEQFGLLLALLRSKGLLANSWVILLSDHGTTLGLEGDRLIERSHYRGEAARLHWLTVNKVSQPHKLDGVRYQLNTSYGQGTDVLSLKQYHILLAFSSSKQWQKNYSNPARVSLMDIAPTILDLLNLPNLKNSDGISLKAELINKGQANLSRPIFLETGYSVSSIETDHIEVEKVLQQGVTLYDLNPRNGLIFVKPSAQKQVLESKQRAVLLDDWLLAIYPASQRSKLFNEKQNSWSMQNYTLPSYFVLANVRTGEWTIGLDSPFTQKAPIVRLKKMLEGFYGDEITLPS
jgi:arylsulfatase A-like enzyme